VGAADAGGTAGIEVVAGPAAPDQTAADFQTRQGGGADEGPRGPLGGVVGRAEYGGERGELFEEAVDGVAQ
jgi:hypothetical protein